MLPLVVGVDIVETYSNAKGLNTAHVKALIPTGGKSNTGFRTRAINTAANTERAKEEIIILHLPSLYARALAGTRISIDTVNGNAARAKKRLVLRL